MVRIRVLPALAFLTVLEVSSAAQTSDTLVAVTWRARWARDAATFRVKVREAELDSLVYTLISPIGLGAREVR